MEATIVGHHLSTLPADDDHPYRTGPWRPQTAEWDASDLTVRSGSLPADLNGVYLRNTENPLHPAIERYHPVDGDGMVHAVTFRDGRASYRNRFVETEGLMAERAAGKALWAGLAESPSLSRRPDGWGARGAMKDASSTDVVVHAGLALTSFYQCGDIYQLDPLTLEQRGRAGWAAQPADGWGVSAHARVDEHTGDLMFFNYATAAPYLHYGVVDRAGNLAHYVPVELPGPRLPHDMAFTEHWTILNDLPLYWDPALLARGAHVPRFHPDQPSRFAILPRHGDASQVRWFEADPTYVLHWVNAFEDGEEIVLDGFYQSRPEPDHEATGGPPGRMFRYLAADALGTRLHRWRFDLRSGRTVEADLSDLTTEFGAVGGASRGRPYRHAYATTNRPGWFLMDGLVRHDTLTGATDAYRFPSGVYCSEPSVTTDSGGADAYLVTMVSDTVEDCSYAAVFACADLVGGPLATVALPERVSSGTHAFWAAGASLPGWDA